MNKYVEKLIDNLPENITIAKKGCKSTPQKLDLVLDGGVFNGSYLFGGLFFLREMEKRNYVKIERLSGCSIGAIAAFIYIIDALDMIEVIYNDFVNNLKQNYCLNVLKNIRKYFDSSYNSTCSNPRNVTDLCSRVNHRLYITYYDIKRRKKVVKSTYKNNKDIFDSLIKSAYVPYLIDGNMLYHKKYMDGINPHIFESAYNTSTNFNPNAKKTLYLDLYGYDKITHFLNVKNEKTNIHRMLSGMLDIHNFFIKQSDTSMCSYVNEWSIFNKSRNWMKKVFETICIYVVYLYVYIKKYVSPEIQENMFYKLSGKIVWQIYTTILESYCM